MILITFQPLINQYVLVALACCRTALHLACAIGSADAVKELLAWKANVNLGDNEAKTPLIKVRKINIYFDKRVFGYVICSSLC